MKKYFLADTDDELVFGDVVSVTLEKKTENGFHKFVNDIVFSEDNLYFLLDMGVIEERECEEEEENNDLINFTEEDDMCEAVNDLLMDFETLENRVDNLEDLTRNVLKETVAILKEFIKNYPKGEQPEQKNPKKK